MDKLQLSILRTLAYADVFDYPLKAAEVWKFLIGPPFLKISEIEKKLMSSDTNGEFFFLPGREKIVALRRKREWWSREKLKIAQKAAGWLRLIPWVKLVGVTGGLAIGNSSEADDIDILIVCSKGRLWLTRLASVLLLEALGQRRRPNEREVRDKICLNMFLDEEHLAVPIKERDLFSAHEVGQLKILWDNGEGSGQKFFWENRWANKFLPNFKFKTQKAELKTATQNSKFWNFLERLVRRLQLWYMKKRRTTEIISDGIVRFHPQDARIWVIRAYNERLQKLGLDKK